MLFFFIHLLFHSFMMNSFAHLYFSIKSNIAPKIGGQWREKTGTILILYSTTLYSYHLLFEKTWFHLLRFLRNGQYKQWQ